MGLISRVSSRTYRFTKFVCPVVVKRHLSAFNFSEKKQQLTKMKYVAAYLLAAQSGSAPSKDSVKKILEAIGADIEADKLDKVFSELDGKNVDEVISEGMGLLASVPSGGAAPAAGAAAG